MVNPALVEAQILGGVVQGLGGTLTERLGSDGQGQPMTAGFMHYLIPTASWVPEIELQHIETPSPHNPLGVKGTGEGGIVPTYAAVASAVEDAVGVPVEEVPLSTETVWRFLAAAHVSPLLARSDPSPVQR
jgi:CO/xanthine dehydrogenase Mo-binding subunit